MHYQKPHPLYYLLARTASRIVSALFFKRVMLRNEIKDKKGAFVVIANHEAALDFVNLIDATRRPMSFVISQSFYNSLPLKKIMNKIGVIPKQQFQTAVTDMKRMRAVIDHGQPMVIYPAGLMCEDGISTPIPAATYKFLKWLDADVYMARITGSYFVMPKWSNIIRRGKTYMDIYQLFSKEELRELDENGVKEKAEKALLFDAYEDQEQKQIPFAKGDNIEGLEHVLYQCPHCQSEYTMRVKDTSIIYCENCGFAHQSDRFGFLHRLGTIGEEWRRVSDWSRYIYASLKETIQNSENYTLSAATTVQMIDPEKDRFMPIGNGTVVLDVNGFTFTGTLYDAPATLHMSITNIPTLPFSPGKYFEIQQGKDIYRMVLQDGRKATQFVQTVKIFYELSKETIKAK